MSWYNNILSKTTSQISNLRSTLLSNESDGDTDDDTHVCRVLRNYYTEKGRPFPPWLPQDPKGAAPPPQPMLTPQVGARYGNMGGGPQQPGGGLSSLWDGPSQAPQPQPQSLRQARTPASLMGGGERRPLPSQRPGSYQGNQFGRNEAASTSPATSGGGSGGSAQDRLRQRLWGGSRTVSPGSGGGQGPFQPPAQSGGGGNYEDRFAPGGMYDGGNSGGGGGGQQPFMGSNAPWAGGGDDYNGGGGGGRSGMPRRQGLPSGPRGYR